MSRFAPYDPHPTSRETFEPDRFGWRAGRASDLESIAKLSARRNQTPLHLEQERWAKIWARPEAEREIWIAERAREVVAFGTAATWEPPQIDAHSPPPGWYLTGVVVREPYRRQGIALELTQIRLKRLESRTPTVHYVASALNQASIDLHAKLGFVEVARDIRAEGLTFTGGVGLLFARSFERS